jgi:excisionase family DNA binding protein
MKKVLNVKKLKDYLSVSESTIRKLVRENKVPFFRIASKILFDQEVIDKWLADQQLGNYNKNI